jgi:hypothetical protein
MLSHKYAIACKRKQVGPSHRCSPWGPSVPTRGTSMSYLTVRTSLLVLGAALPLMAGTALAQTPPTSSPATSPAAVPAVDPAKVVARVNGIEITEGDLAIAAEDPALQMPNVPDEQKREMLTGYLIDLQGCRGREDRQRCGFRPQARLQPGQDPAGRISRPDGQEGRDPGRRPQAL